MFWNVTQNKIRSATLHKIQCAPTLETRRDRYEIQGVRPARNKFLNVKVDNLFKLTIVLTRHGKKDCAC